MVAENLAGMIFFILGTILMLILVPMDRIIKFSLVGLIGGLGVALALVHVMQNIFSLLEPDRKFFCFPRYTCSYTGILVCDRHD